MREGWNSELMREASYELAITCKRVLDILISKIRDIESDLSPFDASSAIRHQSAFNNLPRNLRNRWFVDELWVLRSIIDSPSSFGVDQLDRRLTSRRAAVFHFVSVYDGLQFFTETDRELSRTVRRISNDTLNPVDIAADTYGVNRIIRFSTAGCYLPRRGLFTFVAIPS